MWLECLEGGHLKMAGCTKSARYYLGSPEALVLPLSYGGKMCVVVPHNLGKGEPLFMTVWQAKPMGALPLHPSSH